MATDPARPLLKRWSEYWSWSCPGEGRPILCIILFCYFASVGGLCAARGWTAGWETLGVSGGALSFADSRFITGTLESHRLGYDTYVENPSDPWGRRMNYPRIWLLLSAVPLSEKHGVALGVVLAAVLIGASLLWVGRVNPIQALFVAAFLCSPHVMWVLERGNVDIVIFALLAAGLGAAMRGGRLRPLLYLAILLAGVLKYYPIGGAWTAVRERSWRAAAWGMALVGIFAAYLWLTRADLMYTLEATPRWTWWSYGRAVVFEVSVQQLQQRWGIEMARSWVLPTSIAGVAVAAIAAGVVAVRLEAPAAGSDKRLDGFLLGSGIYAGTFLIGTSFDYKLVFLFFLLPQVFEWVSGRGAFARAAWALLAAIMLSIWSEAVVALLRGRHTSFPPTSGVLLQEAANWALLVMILAINLRLLIRWISQPRSAAAHLKQNSTSGRAEGAP